MRSRGWPGSTSNRLVNAGIMWIGCARSQVAGRRSQVGSEVGGRRLQREPQCSGLIKQLHPAQYSNRMGRSLSVMATACNGQVRCK